MAMPSVIIASVEPSRVVGKLEDLEMLNYSTYRETPYQGSTRMLPRVSRDALANLRFGQLPPITGHEAKLAAFVRPGSKEWRRFFSTRKVVETVTQGGVARVEVTSNLNDVLQPQDMVNLPLLERRERSLSPPPASSERKSKRKPRKYELVNLLTDSYALDKYQFPESVLNSIKFMAVSHPDEAASKAQAYIRKRPGSERAIVVAGNYSRSRHWAKSSVRYHASRFPQTVAASDAVVLGAKMSVYAPGELTDKRWSVVGPVQFAEEVMHVYRMVCIAGTSAPMFALGSELTILDIDINNGDSFECPTVEVHAGPHDLLPDESSAATNEFLSVDGRAQLEALGKCVEVVAVEGENVASAVRISSRHVLVNSHVVEKAESFTVGGITAQVVRPLSRDLWLVKACVRGDVAWSLRDPDVGESVVVCYRKGEKFLYSAPLAVRSTDGETIVMSKSQELLPGMSGGALVSLVDFSLLGVYQGVGSMTALGVVFSQELYTDICTMDRLSEADHDQARDSDGSLYRRMKDRGLVKYMQAAADAMVPVYSTDTHVGMAYCRGGQAITTCDPDVAPLSLGRWATPSVFEPGPYHTFEAASEGAAAHSPLVVRAPTYGEAVFVLGKDDEGPYYSNRYARVVHVGVSASTFVVSVVDAPGALPLVGGLVVAASDAAVVGQYARHTSTVAMGEGGFCVGIKTRVAQRASLSDNHLQYLSRKFPMLHPSSWEEGMIEEVFTHSSVQSYSDGRPFNSGMLPLAFVGDSALKAVLGVKLRALSVPTSSWQRIVQRDMSNSVMTVCAEQLGLVSRISVGRGVSIPKGSKVYADVLEALCGAVYMSETLEVFQEFAVALGLMREEYVVND